MATTYKTPGVYIEEIPKFPPSIAAVETAIPAFIGYTEKAIKNGESLNLKPTRIESIAEYEELFGGGPPQAITVTLNTNNEVTSAVGTSKFYLYDSLRMFYANGGGNCYIVSVNASPNYPSSPHINELGKGIDKIAIEDEPTILVFPDAVTLGTQDLFLLQQKALEQCNRLMDRVVLCDLAPISTSIDFKTTVKDFRDNIGVNSLKYGAAYGPWIKASLPRSIKLRDLTLQDASSVVLNLKSITSDTSIHQIIFDLNESKKAVDALKNAEISGRWEDLLKSKIDNYNSKPSSETVKNLEDELQAIYDLLARIVAEIQNMVVTLPVVANIPILSNNQTREFNLLGAINQYIANNALKSQFDILAAHYNFLKITANGDISLFSENPATSTTNLAKANVLLGYTSTNLFTSITNTTQTGAYGSLTLKPRADVARDAIAKVAASLISFFRFTLNAAEQYEKQFNDALLNAFGTYKSIVNKAAEALNTIPPSGAIAGVYARVDRERGVWKAPANVSLNAVIGPAVKISHEQQGEYNVDVNAGKSINIIRSFTGKGTLVWGARTLAGNDNEWRYISVRRFFNMVEESTKKATEQFVFEPNDANTWVKVQAMIENFLNTLWRQGALQGVKPEHAFYVAVGLGKTMTALDILEGRMIIEIGMAAVRPAEFIILRISHKMAES